MERACKRTDLPRIIRFTISSMLIRLNKKTPPLRRGVLVVPPGLEPGTN